ncbi:MAG: thioesterase II family protein [Candidatus Angelobacter sp.]
MKNLKAPCIAYRKASPHALLRIFCFPYAGAGAAIFRDWARDLPGTIELCPVQLPGRETRAMEPACSRIEPLIEMLSRELTPFFDIPYVFFGYSMGALIAFELARALRRKSLPGPSQLFLAARRSPRMADRSSTTALTDREFIEELKNIGGTPKEILRIPELLELMLPTLRADFSLCESYEYSPAAPLECPLSIFGGKEDADVSNEALAAWAAETGSSCNVKLFDGGHFFIHGCRDALLQSVLEHLSMNAILSGRPASPSFV